MKRYFTDYPLEERKALWEKHLPSIQEQFDDKDYEDARGAFAEAYPDYESMTEFEGLPFDPKDKAQVALANMFGWDETHWNNEGEDTPSFESMMRARNGPDMYEEADMSDVNPLSEKDEARIRQRNAVYDKMVDEDGNSRLVNDANVASLENFDPDIHAPQGKIHDADKLNAPKVRKSEKYVPDKEILEKLLALSPEMQRKLLDQVDSLNPSTPWDVQPKFQSKGENGFESTEKEIVVPEKHMGGEEGWTSGRMTSMSKSFREMVARNCFEKTGRIPDVEFMDSYQFQKAPTYVTVSDEAKAVFNKDLDKDRKGNIDPYVRRQIASEAAFDYDYINADPAKAFSENVTYDSPDLKMVSHEPRDKFVVWNPTNAKGEFGSAKDIHEVEYPMDQVRAAYKDEKLGNKDYEYYKVLSDFVNEHGVEETIKRINSSGNL